MYSIESNVSNLKLILYSILFCHLFLDLSISRYLQLAVNSLVTAGMQTGHTASGGRVTMEKYGTTYEHCILISLLH